MVASASPSVSSTAPLFRTETALTILGAGVVHNGLLGTVDVAHDIVLVGLVATATQDAVDNDPATVGRPSQEVLLLQGTIVA